MINLELQSANDPLLPLRMAEYASRVYRIYRRFPSQYVLYVGEPELRMNSELAANDFLCRFTIKDMDRRETIRRILSRIAKLDGGVRDSAYAKLLILAGLRKLEETIRTEVERMPILNDIMDHEIIGPAIRQGLLKGRQEGEFIMLRGLIGKRFGPIPPSIEERLSNLSVADLEAISLRLFDAQTLDDLFKP